MAINGSTINRVVIDGSDNITLTPTLSVTSTSTSAIVNFISKTILLYVTTLVSIIKGSITKLLTVTSNSISAIIMSISGLIQVSVNSVVSIQRKIGKLMDIISEHLIVVISDIAMHLLAFNINITTTSILTKIPQKIFSITSHATVTLNKQIGMVFSVISATIATLVYAVFPRLGAIVRYTFTADFRDRVTELYKERLSVVQFRDRLIALYKQRSVLANTSNKKVSK